MIDSKLHTFLTLIATESYTGAAEQLSLTQPAVSQHVRSLETEYQAKLFHKNGKQLELTPEGKILEKYARRECALYQNLLRDLEAHREGITRFVVGVTPSAEENIAPKVLATYCSNHLDTKITLLTDTIRNNYSKLKSYEIDIAIVEGSQPDDSLSSLVLDTDYLCLIVSPDHPFARRQQVTLSELKCERLIVRPSSADAQKMFESYLVGCSETLRNFHVMMEIDNVSTIKDLVQANMGVSIIAHSACISEERSGKLRIVPIENFRAVREINMVYRKDFAHKALLEELAQIYQSSH